MTKDEIIRKNVRDFRVAAKLTQEDVSRATGKSIDAVRSWEQDKKTPELDSLIALGELFGRPLDDFTNPAPPPRRPPEKPAIEWRYNLVGEPPPEMAAEAEAFVRKWTPEKIAELSKQKKDLKGDKKK